jgi:hypothetical protein
VCVIRGIRFIRHGAREGPVLYGNRTTGVPTLLNAYRNYNLLNVTTHTGLKTTNTEIYEEFKGYFGIIYDALCIGYKLLFKLSKMSFFMDNIIIR